jgi:hypothetical protein
MLGTSPGEREWFIAHPDYFQLNLLAVTRDLYLRRNWQA